MRLIDADALTSRLKAIFCKECKQTFGCICCPVGDYLEEIKDTPTIEAAHWTNIDEAMPETGVMVLMHRPPKFTAVMSLKYFDERFWWENHRRELTEVYDNDYWMPLPEPPKMNK